MIKILNNFAQNRSQIIFDQADTIFAKVYELVESCYR